MSNPPLRPQASRSSSRSSSHGPDVFLDCHAEQAGRSATNLAAQQSAQSLREATRPAPPFHSRSTTESIPPLTQRHSLYAPNISSPLNPDISTSTSSASSRKASVEDVSNPLSSASSAHSQQYHSSESLRGHVPEIRLHDAPDGRPTSTASRSYTPRSVRDLGSDYTRYFDPFLDRPNQPRPRPRRARDPDTHLLAVARGPTPGRPTQKRLSNPFKDVKRISNPFESAKDAEAGAERGSQKSTDDEKQSVPDTRPTSKRPDTPVGVRDIENEKMPFFQYLDDRLGAAPEFSFPLITDQKEDDDDMHMPQWDDDVRFKPTLKDHFTRQSIVSTLGLVFMVIGLLFIFVILPVVSYSGASFLDYHDTPLSEFPYFAPSEPWSYVNSRAYPLLKNVRTGLIDPDTPESAKTKQSINGETYNLVFSDEFNKKNRTFYPGDDAYWFGFDGWYGATQDLEWYDPDAINTGDGSLLIQMDQFENHDLEFRSGMLNSWNKLCFKGGIFEVSVSLPGPAGVRGLWPGIWTMGNLGRPGYLATTDGLWPYTYSECDVGITANQSDHSGISELPGQRLPSCTCAGEDHPTPGKGRGAPEIDIAEVSADYSIPGIGVATQSYQVAPFDVWYYPDYRFMQNPDYNLSFVNVWTGGPYQQAVSTTTMLNNNWYDGKEFQKIAYEYSPGTDSDAYVAWTVGDVEMMRFDARAIGPNGNIGQRQISEEPMSIIMNLGISENWVQIDWAGLTFPTVLAIDYVRWYQPAGQEMVTCDPPGYETTEYIAAHPIAYMNNNKTRWKETGYQWPKNTFVDGCNA